MATIVCVRCGRREGWGLLSSQAWLEHRDGDSVRRNLCPTCRDEITEEDSRSFLERGVFQPRGS